MAAVRGEVTSGKDSEVLCRFKKLPTLNHATILFVTVEGITGTDNLVKTMVETDSTYAIQIRIANKLPLPQEKPDDKPRPRIDYIIFVVDLSMQLSFRMVQEAIKHVDIDYFVGRCCFVLSKAKQERLHSYDINEVINLVEAYNSPMICGNLENSKEIPVVVDKILHLVEIACGFCNVSPLLVEATKHDFVVEEIDYLS